MGGILEFDSRKLTSLLEQSGVRKTWISLLKAAYLGRAELAYVFEDPIFKDAFDIPENLLQGLSIGEIGVLYEFSVAWEDRESRKENGQFFTPDDVAMFMASEALTFPKGVWLDPCSGIGNLSWHVANMQNNPEDFCLNRLILSDRDELALVIARTLFTATFQKTYRDFFHKIKRNFVVLDFLSVAEKPQLEPLGEVSRGLELIPKHDFVIVNPPYLATNRDSKFEVSECGDLYAYFLENIVKTSKGFVSVTPQSFTNAGKFRSLRGLLLDRRLSLDIYNFDNVPANLFRGFKFGSRNSNTSNSIRAAIMVARQASKPTYRITPLLRWRATERSELFSRLPSFLTAVSLDKNYFPKLQPNLVPLFDELKGTGLTVNGLLAGGPTEYKLFVPAAPRYFISALKNPVKRTSQHTLYFRNEKDMNSAYLLMNSSLMYWWWRVRDGGMTLSQSTIRELPIPRHTISSRKLERALLESERENLVYKMNAGSLQENVKHPRRLIAQLNKLVAPNFAEELIRCHENSNL